jgi:hypothetical protein
MIYTANDPGNWAIWKTKEGNKDLPLHEATQKYRKEKLLFEQQYMDFVATQEAIQRQQAQTGGTSLNGVTSVDFDALPVFQTNTGNTQTLKVKFSKPVLVTGSPLVTLANNQFGGGTAATFNYTYSAGSSTNELIFQHIHPTAAVASQGFSANIVAINSNLAPIGIIVQPGTPTNGDYTFSADTNYTTSGDGNGLSLQVAISGGNITSVICTTIGNDFIPGEIITFADGFLGGGSTGGSITVAASALRADTVSFAAGSTVTLNSGTITTGDGTFNTQLNNIARRQGTPALDFTSTSTKTGVPS